MIMAELINTNQKNKKLAINGHCFLKAAKHRQKIYWKCQQFKAGCKARLVTNVVAGVQDIEEKGEHNHSGDIAKIRALLVYNQIKEAAINTTDRPHEIIAKYYSNLPSAVVGRLPSLLGMKETIRKIRNRKNGPNIRNPDNCESIQLPPEFQINSSGESFVLFDSGNVSNRMIIFGTKASLDLLAESDHWYLDGSFTTIPSQFQQLYIFHCIAKKTPLPLLYALLPMKNQHCCCQLLSAIKELAPKISPLSILLDFNKDMLEALKQTFPLSEIRGCFFHFQDHIRSAVFQNPNCQDKSNTEIKHKIRLLQALAFVPELFVIDYFVKLLQSSKFTLTYENSCYMTPLIEYFKKTWIGEYSFEPPVFPISMWNFYDLFEEDQYVTDNNIESWHRCFNNKIGGNLWRFINVIQREDENTRQLIVNLQLNTTGAAGTSTSNNSNKSSRKRKTTNVLTYALGKAVELFDPDMDQDDERMDYLNSIAIIITFT